MRHIHLDALGGVAGDMFAAALLDAWPDLQSDVVAAASRASGVACEVAPARDDVLAGSRFVVHAHEDERHGYPGGHSHAHSTDTPHPHTPHAHTHWGALRNRLIAHLPAAVARHAVGIFACLADAEANVHGVAPDDVTFHEVGAADSVADIVAAAALIDALGQATWSVSSLPLGGGQVQTAHGRMPVPAPATSLLLRGFSTHDDGIAGERVTPTGAAILRYLAPGGRPPGRLSASGIGFGTRRLPGVSNVLRALAFETDDATQAAGQNLHRDLSVIVFEVDDQTPEDLAVGLEHIRATAGVHDVLQMPAFGKKGRVAAHVQVLADPALVEAVIDACFAQTTTIGLRVAAAQGRALAREARRVTIEGEDVRLKQVRRLGGRTVKAESDDLTRLPTHAERARRRRLAEDAADE